MTDSPTLRAYSKIGSTSGCENGGRLVDVLMRALAVAPAVVASAAAGRLEVDLLEGVLTDIADDHRPRPAARRVVEAPPPRVAQAEAPDLAEHARPPDERVRRRDVVALGIVVRHRHVDAEHLAQQRLRILREMHRVVARPAVAHADVEIPVRSEREVAAVVVVEWLGDDTLAVGPAEIEARRRVGAERIGRRPPEPRDDGVGLQVDEVDVDAAARCVVRRERQPEQPLLPAVADDGSEVEVVGRLDDAALQHADAAVLLDDELYGRVGRILDERHGLGEAARHQLGADLCGGRPRRGRQYEPGQHECDRPRRGMVPGSIVAEQDRSRIASSSVLQEQ